METREKKFTTLPYITLVLYRTFCENCFFPETILILEAVTQQGEPVLLRLSTENSLRRGHTQAERRRALHCTFKTASESTKKINVAQGTLKCITSLFRFQMERKIFEELLELKRLQIRGRIVEHALNSASGRALAAFQPVVAKR